MTRMYEPVVRRSEQQDQYSDDSDGFLESEDSETDVSALQKDRAARAGNVNCIISPLTASCLDNVLRRCVDCVSHARELPHQSGDLPLCLYEVSVSCPKLRVLCACTSHLG